MLQTQLVYHIVGVGHDNVYSPGVFVPDGQGKLHELRAPIASAASSFRAAAPSFTPGATIASPSVPASASGPPAMQVDGDTKGGGDGLPASSSTLTSSPKGPIIYVPVASADAIPPADTGMVPVRGIFGMDMPDAALHPAGPSAGSSAPPAPSDGIGCRVRVSDMESKWAGLIGEVVKNSHFDDSDETWYEVKFEDPNSANRCFLAIDLLDITAEPF